MTASVMAVRGGFGRCRGIRGRHGRFGRPPSDCLDHDGERNEAQPLPRSDLLLELANYGDARRRELGRGQCGASREREEAGEGAGKERGEHGTRGALLVDATTEGGTRQGGAGRWHGGIEITVASGKKTFHENPPKFK